MDELIKIHSVKELMSHDVNVTSIDDMNIFELWINEVDYVLLDIENLQLTDIDGYDKMNMKVMRV